MTKKPAPPACNEDQKSQIDRFHEMAKRLECDEDEAAFDAKLKVIARQKPKPPPEGKKRAPKAEA